MSMQAAGWFPDPAQRHQYRWWSGSEWTEHVSDNGISSIDPLIQQATPYQQTGYEQASPYPAQSTFPAQGATPIDPYQQQNPYGQQSPYGQPNQYGQPNPYGQQSPLQSNPFQAGPGQQPPRQTVVGSMTGYTPVPAATSSSTPRVGVITLVGALVAVVGALLHWLSSDLGSANAFDVPVTFLFDYKNTIDNGFAVGWIVVLLAVSAGASAVVRHPLFRVRGRIAGGVMILVGGAYLFQLSRLADLANVSLTDIVGIGPFLTIGGGLAVLIAGGR